MLPEIRDRMWQMRRVLPKDGDGDGLYDPDGKGPIGDVIPVPPKVSAAVPGPPRTSRSQFITSQTRYVVRPALDEARTTGAVEKVFADEYERLTGRRPKTVSFAGSAATAREHAEGLLRMAEMFPDVRVEYVSAGMTPSNRDTAYAEAGYGRISFNYRYSSPAGRREYLESLDHTVEPKFYGGVMRRGFHTDHTPTGVAVHEFAHLLEMDLLGGRLTIHDPPVLYEEVQEVLARYADIRDAGLAEREANGEHISDDRGIKGLVEAVISGYAIKNFHELIAEVFTDVIMNGDKASELSREIYVLFVAEYEDRGHRLGSAA